MSNPKKLFIAYCEANSNIPEEINQKLKRAGFKFDFLSSAKVKNGESLSKSNLDQSNKGLLLISDNFLKSEVCMQNMLGFINNSKEFANVQVIIIDGRYPTENGKSFETVETSFDRVSNVIKYMNYWQELYLDLRKERRSIAPSDEAAFDEKLLKVKNISAEIGDFLRILQTKEYWAYEAFEKNNFEAFFKKFGDENLFKNYQSLAARDPKKVSSPLEQDLSEIPGMDLLKKAAEKEIVLPVLEEKVAEITTNVVENISQPVDKEELTPVTQDAPTANLVTSGAEKQMANLPSNKTEFKAEHSTSFEQQVDDIVEEVENEELLSDQEDSAKDDQIQPNVETTETSYKTLESVFEEDEDITGDFDPMTYVLAKDAEEETEPVAQNMDTEIETDNSFDIDEMIFDASNLVESGKINEAVLKLKEVLNHEPQNNGARYMYAMLLLNYQEDYNKATKQLKKVVEVDPQNSEAFEHLAKIAEFNNDFPLAKKYYEKVASFKPHTFGIYYKLGLITTGFFSDKKKLAYKYFSKAIKQDKNNDDAHYRLGILLNETFRKPKKAIKHFKKVLKINPDHKFANYDLALLYNELDSPKSAALFYARACQINPEIKTPENDIVFQFDANKKSKKPSSDYKAEPTDKKPVVTIEAQKSEQKASKIEKVVFITGATSGIGKATAQLFAANGYRLILNGRREERLEKLQNDLDKLYDTDSMILPFDVRNIEEVKQAIEELDDKWKNVDILINNAGLAKGYAPIHEGELEHWETMIDTNIKGLLYLTRAIAPHMVKRQSGQIINICSSAGHEVYPNGNVYCATKFAVDALTKSMRLDLYKHKIRVGQVSPGHVEETEFAFVRFEDKDRAKIYDDFQPLKSEDVAQVIYFMVTAPPHVNIQDVQMMGTQQASNVFIDRSGR